MTATKVQALRAAIIASLPLDSSLHGRPPSKQEIYIPLSHVKALRLECSLVIGGRGVGKTFWSAALRSEETRKLIGGSVPDLSAVEVASGYGEAPDLDAYPDDHVFPKLLDGGFEAYHIWRAVLGRWLAGIISQSIPCETWDKTVEWVRNEPEQFGRLLERANSELQSRAIHGLIVFDAIDRLSSDWWTMDTIVRDLLRVLLSMKPFRHLHGKAFLREDQFSRRVTDFPDASKLLPSRVDLTWGPEDLHGLLWQYLVNGPNANGELLRIVAEDFVQKSDEVWTLNDRVKRDDRGQQSLFPSLPITKRDEEVQKSLFAALAGEWMGRDRRRGIPYVWSVGHLADGRGRTSPRSFLAAIRVAAEDSLQRYPDHPYPLHYESIKRGVQKASEIRVAELAEDHPWVPALMEPLKGLTVPCAFDVIEDRWRHRLGESPTKDLFEKLPPAHYEEGWKGVRRDLESLGILETMKDERVNMADLYRVGFGLGRMGGVKPVSKNTGL